MKRQTTPRAFTLIELLIVVAIIAILAAIAVPNFLEAQTRAKVSRAHADLRTVATAVELYYIDNNTYPYSESINESVNMPPGGQPRLNPQGHRVGGLTSPISYITSIPDDVFRHNQLNASGLDTGLLAPVYYEKAGFGYINGVQLQNKPVNVPADAVNNRSTVGTGVDVPVTDFRLTPKPYVLYSLGPDLSPHMVNPAGGFFSRSRYNLGNRYDPTNGTVSSGNIIRYPGGEVFPQ